MSILDKLQKKLYQRREESELKERLERPFDYKPGRSPEDSHVPPPPQREWPGYTPQRFLSPLARKYLAVVVIILFSAAAAIASFAYWRGLTSFKTDRVELTLVGPTTIEAGEVVTIQTYLKNDNPIALSNLRLRLVLPRDATLENEGLVNFGSETPPADGPTQKTYNLSVLAPRQTQQWLTRVRLIGAQGAALTVRAELEYTPVTVSSRLNKTATLITRITDVPIRLTLVTPRIITTGQEVRYEVIYENFSELTFQDTRLKISYPEGFELLSTNPQPQLFDNIWFLGSIVPHQRGKIVIGGRLPPNRGTPLLGAVVLVKNSSGLYVPYTNAESSSVVQTPPLVISLDRLDGKSGYPTTRQGVDLGDNLIWRVKAANTTDSPIRNVRLTVKFEGDLIDYSTINGEDNAAYFTDEKKLVWDETRTRKLALLEPFESREFKFRARLVRQGSFPSNPSEPLIAKARVSITSPTPPPELSGLKVESEVDSIVILKSLLSAESAIISEGSALPPAGPNPLQVRQRSLLTIAFRLKNAYNDLEEVTATARLSPAVRFENTWWPPGEDVFYNPATGELTWRVGRLPAGKGFVSSPRELLFQVSITPADNDAGREVALFSSASVQGQDRVTASTARAGIPSQNISVAR